MDATIVHLSDLHFKNDVENRVRLEYLKKDLERIKTDAVIYTVFTGDLVYSADDDDYDLLFDQLIGPLIELGHEIFIIPGNHDIQRSKANPAFSEKCLKDCGSSYLFENSGEIRNKHPEEDYDSLQHYSRLEELLGPYDERNYWGYKVTRGSVSIVGINSTWLSCERPVGTDDRGKLRAEPYVLTNLTKNLPEETLKVALIHHPLDWLEENTRDAVSLQFVNEFDLVLFGHVHTSDASSLIRDHANCLFLQSPPLRSDWSKGTNGYSIIKCDVVSKKFEIEYRSYSASRRAFVTGEDFAKNGIRHPRKEDEEFFKLAPLRSSLVQKFIDEAPFDFSDWYRNNIRGKTKVLGEFIPPKAAKVTAGDEGYWSETPYTVPHLANASLRDQFFIAPMDSGATTAAYLVFKELADNFSKHEQIPAFFDAAQEKINKASILRAITKSTLVRYTHTEIEHLAEQGSIVVVVDGLSLNNITQFNLFRKTTSEFLPKVRFVCFVSTERHGIATASDGELNLIVETDEIYEFSQLDVSDLRSMVKSRIPALKEEISDSVVNQVIECFNQMDEPIYASTVAVVVDTLAQDPEFKPINKARLIERYVECLLGRFDITDVQEGAFASSDKIDLLSFIARKMLETQKTSLSEVEWAELTNSYQNTYLIELPSGLLEEFIEKGLLTIEGSRVTFRGDHLFSFFIARQMKVDGSFAKGIVSESGLFKHYREIVVYGELEGTDVASVLDSLYSVIGEIEVTLLENYSREGIDLTSEWANTCIEGSHIDDQNSELSTAANQLEETKPTPEQTDRIDNVRLTQVQRRRGIAQRAEVKDAEARLLVAMKLYALLIKNALQLEAADKLKHLKRLFESAELWVGFLCACRESITRHPIVIAGGVRFINSSANHNYEKSLRDFKYNAPNSISRILADSLRNPQLGIAIRKVLPDLDPMSALFARDTILDMIGSANKDSYISSIMKETDRNLVTSSLRTLRGNYLATGRSKPRQTHIASVVDAVAKHPQIRSPVKMNQLKKARLIQELKAKSHK